MKSLYNSANDMSNTIKHITFGVGKDGSLRGFSPGKCHYLHTPEIRKEDNEMELCMHSRPSFASDYMEGAHPAILARLMETNMLKTQGYGSDPFSQSAREKIRAACGCPDAEIHFLVGGTQTNATVIRGLLHSYEGVIAAGSGHISVHEAGAIELGGHKGADTAPCVRKTQGSGYRRSDCGLQKRRKQRTYGHARHGLHFTSNRIRYAVFAQ